LYYLIAIPSYRSIGHYARSYKSHNQIGVSSLVELKIYRATLTVVHDPRWSVVVGASEVGMILVVVVTKRDIFGIQITRKQ